MCDGGPSYARAIVELPALKFRLTSELVYSASLLLIDARDTRYNDRFAGPGPSVASISLFRFHLATTSLATLAENASRKFLNERETRYAVSPFINSEYHDNFVSRVSRLVWARLYNWSDSHQISEKLARRYVGSRRNGEVDTCDVIFAVRVELELANNSRAIQYCSRYVHTHEWTFFCNNCYIKANWKIITAFKIRRTRHVNVILLERARISEPFSRAIQYIPHYYRIDE